MRCRKHYENHKAKWANQLTEGSVLKTKYNFIIRHPPFWDYITWQFTTTIYWGCMQWHIMITRSMDSLGQEFLDLLDQAFWCHAGMAKSLWLHRCGMGCHRHWCRGILLNSWCGGNSWSPISSGLPVVQVQEMWAACMVQVGVMQVVPLRSGVLSEPCSVAVVPLGTVLAALTLHSWRCLHVWQYVEPLLVHTW